ncbi:hypothetical protein A4U53_041335 (plasmid) [Rhizobium ruizarguesonis]|uniref:Uncharacterized protein n=1 Tax=Rhizobium ruizarguesonis TaxID=2081791 RepID=A0ACD5EYN6_9HYPH|nr:hypothetical protein [Rhizobium leguminosarum]
MRHSIRVLVIDPWNEVEHSLLAAFLMSSPAHALTMKECSTKYQAAKADGSSVMSSSDSPVGSASMKMKCC